jgi:hypothetical protein
MNKNHQIAHYLDIYKQVSIFAITIAAVGLGYMIFDQQGVQDIAKVFSNISRGHFSLHDTIYLLVVFSLIWYGLLWIVNGYNEVDQLARWVRAPDYEPKSPILINAILLGIGIFFGLLFVYSTDFPVFTGLFTLYVICDIYLWRRRRIEISKITSSMLEAINPSHKYSTMGYTWCL